MDLKTVTVMGTTATITPLPGETVAQYRSRCERVQEDVTAIATRSEKSGLRITAGQALEIATGGKQ